MVLQDVADILREHVFDRMPIRLLKLPEMELIDRRKVFQHLLPRMEAIDEQWIEEHGKAQPIASRKQLIQEGVIERARYAILSHTWLDDDLEVTYDDAKQGRERTGLGYEKLAKFCEIAAKSHSVDLAWMDTICINKDSTSELDESIRSMYRWYNDSYICIAYLLNTTSLEDMPNDRWFTRGWTLQELLAPARLKFYNKNWELLTQDENDKPHTYGSSSTIHTTIEKATGITPRELQYFKPGVDDIAMRMVWAAHRTTTRGEDRVYSLLGVFSVSFPIAYGEGVERAFFRLIEAILHSFRNVLGVLNWASRPLSHSIHSSRLIPSGPECYLGQQDVDLAGIALVPLKPMLLTHLGLRVRLLLVDTDTLTPPPEDSKKLLSEGKVRLQCNKDIQKEPTIVELYNVHDRDLFGPFRFTFKFTFGIWNFQEYRGGVFLRDTCAAFLFRIPHVSAPPSMQSWETDDNLTVEPQIEDESEETDLSSCKVDTKKVITFLSTTSINRELSNNDRLKRFGIKLCTLSPVMEREDFALLADILPVGEDEGVNVLKAKEFQDEKRGKKLGTIDEAEYLVDQLPPPSPDDDEMVKKLRKRLQDFLTELRKGAEGVLNP
ncbi:hypothetical protein BDQ12DRAFT_738797 [Crucibulum laeve]|uniref:Heterokaryon incompatibility domain-containing protein n=1 Tax=Crucibulum laeve TaxID=68775 RepID=A0A5C3LJL9_9AGAR|nr:hypothetical protein BDQ12DRAFT_738797 [Crucibulum laeve]